MRPVPRSTLAAPFIRAVRASGQPVRMLASLSGFAQRFQLSDILNDHEVTTSDLMIARLQALAQVVHYDGPLFDGDRS